MLEKNISFTNSGDKPCKQWILAQAFLYANAFKFRDGDKWLITQLISAVCAIHDLIDSTERVIFLSFFFFFFSGLQQSHSVRGNFEELWETAGN